MARETFKDWQKGERLTAEHINLLNQAARVIMAVYPAAFTHGNASHPIGLEPFVQRAVIILDNTTVEQMEIALRYKDPSGIWTADTSAGTYYLDATSVGLTKNDLPLGSTITAWWDPQSERFIPVPPPPDPYQILLGRTQNKIRKGESGTISKMSGDAGEEVDTGEEVEALNRLFEHLGKNEWVYYAPVNGKTDEYEIISGEVSRMYAATTVTCHRSGTTDGVNLEGEEGGTEEAINRIADLQINSPIIIGKVSDQWEILAGNPCPDMELGCD